MQETTQIVFKNFAQIAVGENSISFFDSDRTWFITEDKLKSTTLRMWFVSGTGVDPEVGDVVRLNAVTWIESKAREILSQFEAHRFADVTLTYEDIPLEFVPYHSYISVVEPFAKGDNNY